MNEHVYGTFMLLAGCGMGFGFAVQVRRHYREQRCSMNIVLNCVATTLYGTRIVYALAVEKYALLAPDMIGLALILVMIGQWTWYEHPRVREAVRELTQTARSMRAVRAGGST